MKNLELFEKLCNDYEINFTRDNKQHGIILSDNGKELKLTKELINAMFQFDEYYMLSPNEAVKTNESLPKKIHKNVDLNKKTFNNYLKYIHTNNYLTNYDEFCAA